MMKSDVILTREVVDELRQYAFGRETVVVQEQVLDALLEAVELLRNMPTATQFMWTLDDIDLGNEVHRWRTKRELLLGQEGLSNG